MEHAHAVLSSKFVCVSNLIGEYKVNILNVVVAFQNQTIFYHQLKLDFLQSISSKKI